MYFKYRRIVYLIPCVLLREICNSSLFTIMNNRINQSLLIMHAADVVYSACQALRTWKNHLAFMHKCLLKKSNSVYGWI